MDYLTIITEALEKARRAELENLRQKLTSYIENLPCDLRGKAPAHHIGMKEGHKQARHAAIDVIADIWPTE